jgi:hypothetical protein
MTKNTWYIVKRPAGNCEIISNEPTEIKQVEITAQWGPFESESDAIARRVGLIRAGKCQPV